ncbi:hypothetical protein ACTXQV_82880, partial [Klebsiella pneumoniae]
HEFIPQLFFTLDVCPIPNTILKDPAHAYLLAQPTQRFALRLRQVREAPGEAWSSGQAAKACSMSERT